MSTKRFYKSRIYSIYLCQIGTSFQKTKAVLVCYSIIGVYSLWMFLIASNLNARTLWAYDKILKIFTNQMLWSLLDSVLNTFWQLICKHARNRTCMRLCRHWSAVSDISERHWRNGTVFSASWTRCRSPPIECWTNFTYPRFFFIFFGSLSGISNLLPKIICRISCLREQIDIFERKKGYAYMLHLWLSYS